MKKLIALVFCIVISAVWMKSTPSIGTVPQFVDFSALNHMYWRSITPKSTLTIQFKNRQGREVDVELYDATGNLIWHSKCNSDINQVNTEMYGTGIFFIRASAGAGYSIGRFTLQNGGAVPSVVTIYLK